MIARIRTQQPTKRLGKRFLVPIVCSGIVFAIVLLLSVSSWLLWQSGQRAVQIAAATNSSLAAVLDRHAAQMIDSVRIVLMTASQQIGPDPRDVGRRRTLDVWLAEVARDLPHLRAMGVFAIGEVNPVYRFERSRDIGETAFKAFADTGADPLYPPGDDLRFGRAVLDEASNHWVLPVSAAIGPRHGVPGYVVVALLDLHHLQELYASLDTGANGTVVLIRADGNVLARHPYDPANVGQNISNGLMFREHLPKQNSGTFQAYSTIDGVERIITYRRLDSGPLVVVVSRSVGDVLAKWRQDLSVDGLISGICALLLLSLGLLLVRVAKERDRADRHLSATLAHMEHGLLMVGPDQRTEVYNCRALELLDLPEELMSRRPAAEEVFAYQAARGEFIATTAELHGQIVKPILSQTPDCYERRRPNGQLLEIRTTPLPDGGAVRTYSDITARHKAIEEVNASMAFANSLVSSSPDCIQLLDVEGKITFMSDLGQELLEIDNFETVRGRSFVELFSDEDQNRVELALRRASDGHTDRFMRRCPTFGGVVKWWDFIVTPVHRMEQKPTQIFVVARDITAGQAHAQELGRAKKAAEDASLAKTRFLASMSHEIRTPLNAILGFASLARERQVHDPELTRQLELIQKAGEALLTIINDVLDLSKIEAGKFELEERPLDLRGLLTDCLSLTHGLTKGKLVALDCHVDPAMPEQIVADEARLRQILLNILNNAIKFTPSGTVRLSVAPSPQAGSMVIAVTDTGIGIASDALPSLFQDFVQVDGAISRQYGGTGLGLSISRRLTLMMGGEIGVSSTVGVGSTFHVTLPMIEAVAVIKSYAHDLPANSLIPMRILLVDDMSINLEIVGEMLGSAGHLVTCASNGPSAIVAYREEHHDLILMDVQMPEMDGLETTRHIRELDHRGRVVPVIALTANVFSQQIESYRQAGMNDHLGKPFRRDHLLATVERWRVEQVEADTVASETNRTDGGFEDAFRYPVVDLDSQNELVELIGIDKLLDLMGKLREELTRRLSSANDADLRADAHSITSMAGFLGFIELSKAARRLEEAVENGEDRVPPLIQLLAARTAAQAELATAYKKFAVSFDPAPR